MRRRAAALAVPFSAVLLALSSCSSIPEDWKTPAFLQSDEKELDKRLPTVTGEVGEEPKMKFPDIAPPGEQISGVVKKGAGENELVRKDDILKADIVDYQWTAKGKVEKTQSTYDTGAPVLLQLGQMNEDLTKDLVNQPLGSRVVFVFPGQDPQQAAAQGQPSPKPGDSVSVVDIQGRYGKGDTVEGEQTSNGGGDLPTVKDTGADEPKVTMPKDTDPPKELKSENLIEGEGPKVKKEQQLVVQYTGVSWKDGKTFDSTWKRGGAPATFPIGVGQVIKGWDQGLVGKRVGSRVLLVVPEDLAYGKDAAKSGSPEGTLVFVVDILGAVDQPPPPEESKGDGGEKKDDKGGK